MSSNLEPRSVKPSATLKWAKQALDLIGRGFVAWFIVMGVFCFVIYLCRASNVASQIFAATAYLIGIEVSALVDDSRHRSVFQVLNFAREQLGRVSVHATKLIMIVTLVSLVFYALTGSPSLWINRWYDPALLVIPDGSDLFTFLCELFAKSMTALLLFQLTCMTPLVSSPFQYHLMSFFGAGWLTASQNGAGGLPLKNLGAMSIFQLGGFAVVVLCAVLVPILAPVLYAFLSAFSYVAFRDIYLGIGENRKVSMVEVRRSSAAAAQAI